MQNDGSDSDLPLFREEAQSEQRERWLGSVMLDPKLSPLPALAGFLAFVTIALLAVAFSDYTRRVTISGWLVPDLGLTKIESPISGNVERIFVQEGTIVVEGDSILTIVSEVANRRGGDASEQRILSLKAQRDALMREIDLQTQLGGEQLQSARIDLINFNRQFNAIAREIGIEAQKISASGDFLASQRQLFAQRLITREQLMRSEQEQLEILANIERLNQQQISIRAQINEAEATLRTAPIVNQSAIAQLDRQVAEIDQQLVDADIQQAITLKAPTGGLVSSLQTNPGARASPSVPLATIIPEGSVLEAHLYAPSRSTGLVTPGQSVTIRYEAFPFQRYGTFKGEVISISRSAVSPNELPPQLSGFAAGEGASEPLYTVRVKIDRQSTVDGENALPLRAGHRLTADIRLETRPVYSWVLAPIVNRLAGAQR